MSHLSGSTAGKLADETDLVVVPSVDDSPTKSLEHSPEDVSSPSPDIELVETIEDSKPADSDLLEFDFDDFSPDEDSDTVPQDTCMVKGVNAVFIWYATGDWREEHNRNRDI